MFGKSARPSEKPTSPCAVTDTAPCEKALRARVSPEAIAPVRQAVVGEFQRQAALPGFRKGKAPADLVARQYGKEIQEETLHRVTKQVLEQATAAHQLKPVGPFVVTKAEFTEAAGLWLEATVEVEPSFALAGYTHVPIARPSADVSPQDVDQALARLQESMAQMVPVPEPAGGATETPKERRVPALDDELAKDLGYETLARLREHVEAKLREQKRAHQAQAMEAQLSEALLARHAFEVPKRLIARQTERLTRDFKVRLLMAGTPEEQLGAEVEKFEAQLRTSAERHVKLGFILDRIAAQEAVTVTQDELVQRLWQLAQRWKKDPAEIRRLFDAEGLWPSLASSIRQEKTMALLLAAAAVENGKDDAVKSGT
jgi:FKBP-type peptidyl-prolyl cis-trans isomerase (trigger factor)